MTQRAFCSSFTPGPLASRPMANAFCSSRALINATRLFSPVATSRGKAGREPPHEIRGTPHGCTAAARAACCMLAVCTCGTFYFAKHCEVLPHLENLILSVVAPSSQERSHHSTPNSTGGRAGVDGRSCWAHPPHARATRAHIRENNMLQCKPWCPRQQPHKGDRQTSTSPHACSIRCKHSS